EQPCEVARDSGLPHTLSGPDHRQRGPRKRRELGRVEAEVGPQVRQPVREYPARQAQPLARAEHRLVGKVDHDFRLQLGDRALERGNDRHAVVVAAAQLLAPAGEPQPRHLVRQRRQRVAHHGRVVLAVANRQSAHHVLDVTSSSIRVVYFSNARVSVENWMIRSCPWNGYFRQTSTWRSLTSITL